MTCRGTRTGTRRSERTTVSPADSETSPRPPRRRRIRSPHPGVVLIPPDPAGRHLYWRARYDDPDSGKRVKVRIDPLVVTTKEARRDWAIRKAQELRRRRDQLEHHGAVRKTGTALDEVVGQYFEAHPHLRPKTRKAYRAPTDKLLGWAAKHSVRSADDLNRARLVAFVGTLGAERKRTAVEGGRRGQYRTGTEPRSAHSVNKDVRALRTVLGYCCDRDLFAALSHEDLRRALKQRRADLERVQHLKPHDLQKLLEAAMRHDADTFDETRKEHAGLSERGTTLKYAPIAPFVACVLLTGMRLGEALELEWAQVDLDALDHEGKVVGEIHLKGSGTKTHRARTIGLEVSPALRALLAAMKLKHRAGKVFGQTNGSVIAAEKRLAEYGAPKAFGWQVLRQTCGTYLTNAPGIFGAASAYRSAKQLGHSVAVAEKHYVDVARGIPRDARTLEAAMQIEAQLAKLLRRVSEAPLAERRRKVRTPSRARLAVGQPTPA